jgi:hypothetical protein
MKRPLARDHAGDRRVNPQSARTGLHRRLQRSRAARVVVTSLRSHRPQTCARSTPSCPPARVSRKPTRSPRRPRTSSTGPLRIGSSLSGENRVGTGRRRRCRHRPAGIRGVMFTALTRNGQEIGQDAYPGSSSCVYIYLDADAITGPVTCSRDTAAAPPSRSGRSPWSPARAPGGAASRRPVYGDHLRRTVASRPITTSRSCYGKWTSVNTARTCSGPCPTSQRRTRPVVTSAVSTTPRCSPSGRAPADRFRSPTIMAVAGRRALTGRPSSPTSTSRAMSGRAAAWRGRVPHASNPRNAPPTPPDHRLDQAAPSGGTNGGSHISCRVLHQITAGRTLYCQGIRHDREGDRITRSVRATQGALSGIDQWTMRGRHSDQEVAGGLGAIDSPGAPSGGRLRSASLATSGGWVHER